MNYSAILHGADFEKKRALFTRPKFKVEIEDVVKQYDVGQHDVLNPNIRRDKIINKDTEQVDEAGNPITIKASVPVVRIGMSYQEYIVSQRKSFMLTNPVNYNITFKSKKSSEIIDILNDILYDNKIEYKNKETLEKMMSEMECARLWYFVKKNNDLTLRCKTLSPFLGDTLYPLKNEMDDLVAFGREYKTKEFIDGKDVDIDHFDIYTDIADYYYVKSEGEWVLDTLTDGDEVLPNPVPNPVGKIMAIYWSQDAPEWYNVQSMISRVEEIISNHGDMNDYFGSPILAVMGQVLGFSQKGESGKILELAEGARANYLALNTPPESIKLEINNLREMICLLSNTAEISFDKVNGIGNLSALALKLLFISTTMAAKSKGDDFSLGLVREINLLATAIGKVIKPSLESGIKEIRCNPIITPYVPKDLEMIIKTINESYEKGTMSLESVIENNELIIDKEKEIQMIREALDVSATEK